MVVGTDYYRAHGTSMAAPHVAGVAALLVGQDPQRSQEEIVHRLKAGISPFPGPPQKPVGTGIVNALRALSEAPSSVILSYRKWPSERYVVPQEEWELSLRLFTSPEKLKAPFPATLSTDHPQVTITKPQAIFQQEGDTAFANNDQSRFRLLYQGPESALFGDIPFRLRIPDANLDLQTSIHLGISSLSGWPQKPPPFLFLSDFNGGSSPTLIDLDGDGMLEVIVGSGLGTVRAWHKDGSPVEGWPQFTGASVHTSPAVADLDQDGVLEIIAGSTNNRVFAWHPDGTPVAGWPTSTGRGEPEASPAVADLNGDGKLEVVIGTLDGKVHAWHHDGTVLQDWPKQIVGEIYASAAIADLEGDGRPEVIVGTLNGDRAVYAWHGDGSLVRGWPRRDTGIIGSPAIADLNGDGTLEVVVAGKSDGVYVWRHDGTPFPGWPKRMAQLLDSSPVIADLDGDGRSEILVCNGDRKVYAWHADGSLVTGWPTTHAGTGDRLRFARYR